MNLDLCVRYFCISVNILEFHSGHIKLFGNRLIFWSPALRSVRRGESSIPSGARCAGTARAGPGVLAASSPAPGKVLFQVLCGHQALSSLSLSLAVCSHTGAKFRGRPLTCPCSSVAACLPCRPSSLRFEPQLPAPAPPGNRDVGSRSLRARFPPRDHCCSRPNVWCFANCFTHFVWWLVSSGRGDWAGPPLTSSRPEAGVLPSV